MKVRDLIAKLQTFDPEVYVAAVAEEGGESKVYEISVAAHTTRCRRSDAGGISFLSPQETDALEVLLLELDEA